MLPIQKHGNGVNLGQVLVSYVLYNKPEKSTHGGNVIWRKNNAEQEIFEIHKFLNYDTDIREQEIFANLPIFEKFTHGGNVELSTSLI